MAYQPVYTLRTHDYQSDLPGEDLSTHPNLEGAQLSALFHVQNGEQVTWRDGPYAGTWLGAVLARDGVERTRFCVVRDQ